MGASHAAYDAEVDRNQNRAANERASDVVYVRPQSTARMHHPFVDMEAGCSDDDDDACIPGTATMRVTVLTGPP